MEENIDLIFSLRRAAFLLHPFTVQGKHLFTRNPEFPETKITRTHKNTGKT